MDIENLREVLEDIKNNKIDIESALAILKKLPFEDLGFAKLDNHRTLRNGYPEVIYCENKTKEQIVEIFKCLASKDSNIIATRANEEIFDAIKPIINDAIFYKSARIIVVNKLNIKKSDKIITVLTAGTSDISIAEEAAITAEVLGNKIVRIYDVGVAGLHRLLAYIDTLIESNVLIVVAGMEGALASVVAGLVDKPVIAVPTSVGYGTNFGGLSALLTMLNSCASGIGVVNIDNGFGAGYLASMINK